MAFAVTPDQERQLAAWEQVSRPWTTARRPGRSRRLLTEERVPATAALARYVGVEAYEAAGGTGDAGPLRGRARERRLARASGAS